MIAWNGFSDTLVSLKKAKDALPPRYDIAELDVPTNPKDLEKNLKLQGQPSDIQ